ncbi:MAG TPA: alpha-glucan family phosphorylase [Rikenellaceae bacterium]|nr:MAG: alpha-glucan phosphorylase [Bacteroidetes bacterium GWE2_40_15]HBZ24910.1 alpha-glucan family phosphorylase [Rikenellaceae bacterium]
MSEKKFVSPDYLFEVSWEVCNKVGGIHTVIATKALNLSKELQNNHILIGPDVWRDTEKNPEFLEDQNLLRAWRGKAAQEGLRIRVGRWNVSGTPIVILVDFSTFLSKKDEILTEFWIKYGLDSIAGHWDYLESTLFGYATGKVIESYVKFNLAPHHKAVAQFHEWMTGAGVLYLKTTNLPVATVFTTHATVVGRSIAGNNLPLYDNMTQYSPEEKAQEFNVVSKHSLEKIAANQADVFTTVSDITARECSHFLGRKVDVVTPNGFENSFTPKENEYKICAKSAKKKLIEIARLMTGIPVSDNALMVGISGRYEYKNKGIDIYLDALGALNGSKDLKREIIAWIFVPAGHKGADRDLLNKIQNGGEYTTNTSHTLNEPSWDPVLKRVNELNLLNREGDLVKLLFIPSYLNGNDGIFNFTYYQLLCGLDLSVFPSYYEPWGYTPLESLAFGVPTITTSLTGFGLWVRDHSKRKEEAIEIIERGDFNYSKVVEGVVKKILHISHLSDEKRKSLHLAARDISKIALWDNQIVYYKEAYSLAIAKVINDKGAFPVNIDEREHSDFKKDVANKPIWSKILINKRLPKRLEHLETLSRNLWWCWNEDAIELFKMVDKDLWEVCEGNPIHLLDMLSLKRYQELESDSKFLRKLDAVYDHFQEYISAKCDKNDVKIAYFSMEFGLDKSLKIYSGGLGVLAGDYLKEASDMMVPLTAVGLLYRYGYFTQKLSAQGDQVAFYEPQDFMKIPATPVRDEQGKWTTVVIALPGRNMTARLWRVDVGRTELILLDTDHEDNLPEDRAITHHLYGGDWENRLKQEMLLGIGGVRALRALGREVDLYHLNEGHAAFIGLERLREYVTLNGLTFAEATEVVRASSLYTTHTPVPAGHDAFSEDILRGYFSHYPKRMKISWEMMMSLGKIDPADPNEKFSMSNMAANLSQEINGVSWLHGKVSRDILSPLWPGYLPQELHVSYVTNGVHYPTWTAPEWKEIHSEVFGEKFQSHHYDKSCFEGIYKIDDSRIWDVRKKLRSKLINIIKQTLSNQSTTTHYTPEQIVKIKETLRDDVLTIGFARRFATYKRAHLIFRDLERLKKIVNDPKRPVQFLFAGKAHPADKAGQDLIKRIVEISVMPEFIGKVLFIPGYDITLAKYLVQGVDIWMNTPTRPLEASGTSGEKAVMNGVMHFSVLDGWWVEGYKEGAGWALPLERTYENQDFQNELDAATIYNMLENEITPLFYNVTGKSKLPVEWIEFIKNTIAKVAGNFTTNRMLSDYLDRFYNKLKKRHIEIAADDFALAREIAQWKKRVRNEWPFIEVISYNKPDNTRTDISLGEEFTAEIIISTGDLKHDEIGVEMIIAENGIEGYPHIVKTIDFEFIEYVSGAAKYRCSILADTAGAFSLAGRLYAKNPKLPHRQDFDLVKWL